MAHRAKPDVMLGVLAMYVDDGLLAGTPEVVQRVGALILSARNTKLQTVLANSGMGLHAGQLRNCGEAGASRLGGNVLEYSNPSYVT